LQYRDVIRLLLFLGFQLCSILCFVAYDNLQ